MKIFTRIALIIAGVFAGIGIVCLLIASSLGLTRDTFMQMVNDGKFRISIGDDNDIEFFGLLDGMEIKIFDDDDYIYNTEVKEESTVEIEEKYTKLDLEYGAGKLDIYYEDVEHIQVHQKNVVGFRTYGDEDTLHIEGGIGIDDSNGATLTIVLPQKYFFEEVDLEIGAAQANIEGLAGGEIKITVGAGEANVEEVIAKSFDLEVGAGEANVMGSLVDELDVEVGVGQATVGISGAEQDYNYNVECGIGSVKVGNNSYGGLGAEQKVTHPGADGVINIDCGIGEVIVTFVEEL